MIFMEFFTGAILGVLSVYDLPYTGKKEKE